MKMSVVEWPPHRMLPRVILTPIKL